MDRDYACLKETLRGMHLLLKCFLLPRWRGLPPATSCETMYVIKKLRNVFFARSGVRLPKSERTIARGQGCVTLDQCAYNREHIFGIKLRRVFVFLQRYGLSQAEIRAQNKSAWRTMLSFGRLFSREIIHTIETFFHRFRKCLSSGRWGFAEAGNRLIRDFPRPFEVLLPR